MNSQAMETDTLVIDDTSTQIIDDIQRRCKDLFTCCHVLFMQRYIYTALGNIYMQLMVTVTRSSNAVMETPFMRHLYTVIREATFKA